MGTIGVLGKNGRLVVCAGIRDALDLIESTGGKLVPVILWENPKSGIGREAQLYVLTAFLKGDTSTLNDFSLVCFHLDQCAGDEVEAAQRIWYMHPNRFATAQNAALAVANTVKARQRERTKC